MRALIIGASGLVGSALMKVCAARGDSVVGTFLRHAKPGMIALDLRDRQAVSMLVRDEQPDVIYLPAAATNVDWCEEHEQESYEVNVVGPMNVVAAASHGSSKIVYFSTDYVFDGVGGPYGESDSPFPVNVYGRHKLAAEKAVSRTGSGLIVRTTWVFGTEEPPRNFVGRVIAQLASGQPVKVPVDQWGNPTYAPNLAATVRQAIEIGATGIVNIAGRDIVTRYDLALAAAAAFGLPRSLVIPVSTEELRQRARRPLRGGLKVNLIENLLPSTLMSLSEGLAAMKQKMETARTGE